jgi:hypothetical protein
MHLAASQIQQFGGLDDADAARPSLLDSFEAM